jgi:hypothetical protein
MPKKPRSQATETADGLRLYAESAPLAVMRELAAAALWRGFTLGAIARKCKDDATIDSSNVRRYFESRSPRTDTIELLRRTIGLKKRHIQLAQGQELTEREYAQIAGALRLDLISHEAFFNDGAVECALTAFSKLTSDDRRALLNAYELQRQRTEALMGGVQEVPTSGAPHEGIIELARAMHRHTGFNLLAELQPPVVREQELWDLWLQLTPPLGAFSNDEAEMIVYAAAGLLRRRGIDTQPMERRLHRGRAALQRAESAAKPLKRDQ